ncbi:TetR/AcrR family transcriptional regulator [Mucilaginibacter sp. HMF5004]|uniref:TetR/AcrR family transcriptional regulator n=1 Tax=Mucilaginibacter rivuli TaxID=2857527 RepID=UPI001C5FEE26|nr:TetR/AcrR family transcriptional regulator [Mucilaginibacter rivuli]MBW4888326.1 TetR/AcrR family transcriptional regulator [Mucilaginibacter rivuli]
METKVPKAERTRKFITEATAALFNTQGYAGTALSDITDATGLTKGSIYGNFENKEEVALAAFDHNLSIITRSTIDKINRADSYRDKLMVYVKVYHAYTGSGFPKGGCPILNTAVEADDTGGLLKERAEKAVLRWKKGITNLVQGGIDAGEFKRSTDQEAVAISIIALIEGGIMIAKLTDTPAIMSTIVRSVSALIDELKV